MTRQAPRHLYGPVPSRRLGRSLGVDLVPYKTCSYDCLYCQLGRTTTKVAEPREYGRAAQILSELRDSVPFHPAPDFICLAGSGEPTLHAGLGEVIRGIKRLTNIPVAVLTNGSLLWRPEVRDRLQRADVLMPSLDAGTPEMFQKVNRPHPDITFEAMTEGLIKLGESFRGTIWLEVFLLAGLTDTPQHVRRVATIADRMRPSQVHLNTVSRPPAERHAFAVPEATLGQLGDLFSGETEVVAEKADRPSHAFALDWSDMRARGAVAGLLTRRPATVDGISKGLGLHPSEVTKYLRYLCSVGVVRPVLRGDQVFYARSRDNRLCSGESPQAN